MEHKLDCCVVRDLLPAYLEGLTEEETTRQVEAHLEECPECRRAPGGYAGQPAGGAGPQAGSGLSKR